MKGFPVRTFLTVLAATTWFGVLLQLVLSVGLALNSGHSAVSGLITYLGFFTVLTDILVAVVSTAGLLAPGSALWGASLRGCITTSIVFVGLSYHFLLSAIWNPQGWQLVADVILHYVVPVGALAYWLLDPPTKPLPITAPLVWAVYPCVYFIYAIVRGSLIGSYPYFFIDVGTLGYTQTLVNSFFLLACFIALGYAVRYTGRYRRSASRR